MGRADIALIVLLVAVSADAARHVYEIVLDDDLETVTVTARLAEGTARIRAKSDDAPATLALMRRCDDDRPVGRRRGASVRLESDVRCVRYLSRLVNRGTRFGRLELPEDIRWGSPGQWLWRPSLGEGDAIDVELILPRDVSASLPWREPVPGRYVIEPSPGTSEAVSVFGRFDRVDVPVPGAVLRVAAIAGPIGEITRWLRTTANDVAGVYGRFPNASPQVVVLPGKGRGGSGVHFGHVIRDGGEAVQFFIEPGLTADEMERDWTATHEFSHLMLPYVRDRWVSEGFASYYQNVLLARRGVYEADQAWSKLMRSFARADAIENPPLLRDIDTRPFWEVRMLIYWSGAAMALEADVSLRSASDGVETLDSVLGRLQACCLPAERIWHGEELFSKLDDLTDYPVFRSLYDEYQRRSGMPDLEALYRELGLVSDGEASPTAPLATVREAIMAP